MDLNTVFVSGRLTRDPELKVLPSGGHVCSFSIASGRTFTDRDGKKQEETEYVNVVVFGKAAENSAKYLVKGQQATTMGRLQTRSWEKDGQKQYRTEVIAERVGFGPKASGATAVVREESQLPEYPEEEINPEDIPF